MDADGNGEGEGGEERERKLADGQLYPCCREEAGGYESGEEGAGGGHPHRRRCQRRHVLGTGYVVIRGWWLLGVAAGGDSAGTR